MNDTAPDRRSYRMDVRAETASATRARIVAAVQELFLERWLDEISLRDVAARADVALQTILRHFGTRDALMAASFKPWRDWAERERFTAPVGDIKAAVVNIVAMMEVAGPRVLRGLAQEDRVGELRASIEHGRHTHRRWVEAVFGPLLPTQSATRSRRLAQLVVITDVYTWKLLRLDQGLSRKDTELAMVEMIEQLLTGEERKH